MDDMTFIGKSLRPDIGKQVSMATYEPAGAALAWAEGEQAYYPGVSLKGCSKDGKDGKDGSDGAENPNRIEQVAYPIDQIPSAENLAVRFRPQLREQVPQALNIRG